ncbi:MAG: hypothetical protein N3B18_10355 [Desulfobacterota bacterium]|nr:hypothetical protein [Thermodesulfobacteriota bacterium]
MRFYHAGLARIDFAAARVIAGRIGFDPSADVRDKRACGPGCDYLIRDKRFYVTSLVRYIRFLQQTGSMLPDDILRWCEEAEAALSDYAAMEQAMLPSRKGK